MPRCRVISLIGNPNCGKTTVFNALTGSHQQVGNWPGVTVDKKTGSYTYREQKYEVVDLPGTYALDADNESISQDERIARDWVLEDQDSLIINIIDAANLQRNLFLTAQLLESDRPLIIVLNMMDVAKTQGYHLDIEKLQEALGYPVIAVTANKGRGIKELKEAIASEFDAGLKTRPHHNTLSDEIQGIIDTLLHSLPAASPIRKLKKIALLELLTGDIGKTAYSEEEKKELAACQKSLDGAVGGIGADIAISGARYEMIDKICNGATKKIGVATSAFTETLDKIALGRYTAFPLFLFIMLLMFEFSVNMGAAFTDFFDITFGSVFVDNSRILFTRWHFPEWLITLLSDGLGVGIQTTSTFIPVIFFMFLFLSFLEDSGYLARAAMVVDRFMRYIGLPGKAFVPMVVGFGCNIPAIMGTRILENSNDRLLSISMIPFMSCGARLPVYALFAALFFPQTGGLVVFGLYFFGILMAVATGLLFKHTLLGGGLSPFMMELPLYHRPTLRGLFISTWQRLKAFIVKAGRAILIVVCFLSIFNSLGTDGTFGHSNTDKSLLAVTAQSITPVLRPMGLTEENWPATVGLVTGILAKEVVIGTLNTLYQQLAMGEDEEPEEEANVLSFAPAWHEALDTTWENLHELPSKFLDPLAINSNLAGGDLRAVQEENDVSTSAILKIHSLFPSIAAVVAYLIFVLLYTPCVAALGAVYRETNLRWTVLIAVWCLAIAWICATAYYQLSLLGSAQTESAIIYLIAIVLALILIYLFLKFCGRRLFLDEKGEK